MRPLNLRFEFASPSELQLDQQSDLPWLVDPYPGAVPWIRRLVYHVDQLRAGFASRTGRKCDTCKALEFSTLWFGTRRLKVQILSPLSNLYFTQHFAEQQNSKTAKLGTLGTTTGFCAEISKPRPTSAETSFLYSTSSLSFEYPSVTVSSA